MSATGPLGRHHAVHARHRLADGLEAAAERARRPAHPALTARPREQREAGDAAYQPLLALAARLRRDDPPPQPEGVALARRLGTDMTSELWSWHEPGALRDAARAALEACDRPEHPSP